MPSLVKITLDGIAHLLADCRRGGPEPLVDLDLSYRPDPAFAEIVSGIPAQFKEHVAPVLPVFSLSWAAATRDQRAAFVGALGEVETIRTGLATRSLGARLELPAG